MTKADLKETWGKYCDTDVLVDRTRRLLSKYNYRNSEHGVCTMLNEYFTNKEPLIRLLETSPHYNGNMRAVLDIELDRCNDPSRIGFCCRGFLNRINAYDAVYKKVDEKGKTFQDYLKTGIKSFTATELLEQDFRERFTKRDENINKFNRYSENTVESEQMYERLRDLFSNCFSVNISSTVIAPVIEKAATLDNPVEIAPGTKTSRAFNKVCVAYGLDKLPNYNKEFAAYADLVSPNKRKLKFFISVNPLDYLTMSFGNNWHSCHSIAHHGGWCGGCMSYMLDNSSIITYVHTDIPTNIEEGKIYREMFHYHNGAIIQSRIYPQSNDGAMDLYKTFREIVLDELSPLIGVDANSWELMKNHINGHVTDKGAHYRDYFCSHAYMFCTTEIDGAKETEINIGHNTICTYCGREDSSMYNSSLNHSDCKI